MFDLNVLDTKTPMDAGAPMAVMNPGTNRPMYDGDTPITITLAGRDAERVREIQHELQNRRLDQVRRNSSIKMTSEDNERDLIEILVAATIGWTIPSLDGEPFPFNERNARRLWSDERFIALRRQADAFISDYSNFMKD
jgi:hypothetical protein